MSTNFDHSEQNGAAKSGDCQCDEGECAQYWNMQVPMTYAEVQALCRITRRLKRYLKHSTLRRVIHTPAARLGDLSMYEMQQQGRIADLEAGVYAMFRLQR